MLDAILVNSWRAHQAVFDVAPWMATLAEPPTLAQVRRKLHGAETIEDYVWYTSTASLAEVASLKRSNLAITNLRDDSPAGAVFIQEDADAEKRRKLSANENSQKKSPSKSPGPSQDAHFQEEGEQPDEGELVEEDQEDEREGGNTDEQNIEEEEIGEQYYYDVYFPSDIGSFDDSTGEEEEEDSE
ncbi:hypothetical protein IV203_017846 [Nitzschia inconspicua]|uniref:Uncharacterized protein n=1 Tax=Nitzschia inconspicua TaxID=303405 RepID=A0A9K3M0B2_9STRA|nr:hypothetical protein IV203_020545 [Nitzschia inconspicua]KAG7371705.1 hypothetical protein IV203_017846 [Nitzschia inconspicua]